MGTSPGHCPHPALLQLFACGPRRPAASSSGWGMEPQGAPCSLLAQYCLLALAWRLRIWFEPFSVWKFPLPPRQAPWCRCFTIAWKILPPSLPHNLQTQGTVLGGGYTPEALVSDGLALSPNTVPESWGFRGLSLFICKMERIREPASQSAVRTLGNNAG